MSLEILKLAKRKVTGKEETKSHRKKKKRNSTRLARSRQTKKKQTLIQKIEQNPSVINKLKIQEFFISNFNIKLRLHKESGLMGY